MSDDALREELAAIELVLSRPALWTPIEVDGQRTMVANPRAAIEARRDELRKALSETKITMLDGFQLFTSENHNWQLVLGRPNEDVRAVEFEELFPDCVGREQNFDFEISVTARPRLEPAKKAEDA